MAVKTPIRYVFDNSGNITEFSEFQSADFIGIDDGGTGAITASGARTALGLQIGVDVQAYDAELAALSGLTPTDSNFIVGNGSTFVTESGATVRNSLGLGTSDSVQFSTLLTSNLTVSGASLTLEGATNDSFETTLTVTDPTADRTITFPNATGTVALTSDILAVDVDIAGDSGTGAVTDAQTLTIAGTSNEIETSAANQTITIGLPNDVTIGNNLTVTGNLTVSGTTTTLETETIQLADNTIVLNSNYTGSSPSENGGIEVERGTQTNKTLVWNETSDKWTVGSETFVAGTFEGALTGNAATATALATGRTVGMTGDVVWTSASFDGSGNVTGTATIQAGAVDFAMIADTIDEDNMASNSATKLPTQQSVKAYVDSQIQTEETIEDFVGGMVTGNTETLITVSYEDSDGTMDFVVDNDLANYDNTNSGFITATLTQEQVEDFVGGMISGTQTFITVGYDDTGGNLTYVVPVKDEDNMVSDSATHLATQQSIKAYVDSQIQTEESIEDFVGGMVTGNTETFIAVTYEDSDGTMDFVVPVLDEDNMSTNSDTHLATQQSIKAYVDSQIQTEESIEDFVGGMLTGNTETLITVTYEDSDGTMDFVVNNDLSAYDNSSSGFITATLTQEQVEDFVGGMLDGDETFITVAYDDTDGNIDFTVPVKDEDNMASDSASHLATQQSIKAYVDSQVTAQDLDFQGDSGGALAIDLDSETLTIAGGTGIDTAGSGNQISVAIDSSVATLTGTQTLTNKTINLENNKLIVEYAVTVSGGKFVIDGESQATISFNPGIVYRFDLSDSSVGSHPFALSVTDNNSGNSEYTTGKTESGTQGQSGAYIEYAVTGATPDILYYYCESHSGMGGTITVFGSSYGDADVYSFLDEGTGITISSSGTIATTITQYSDSDAQAVSINNLVEDTTPQLGGNLDINSNNITGTGNIDTSGDITITSTSDTSAAGPIINLVRDSASPADADYLGQIKFKGDDDGGASTVYAKITGKIDDATAGTEDGLIEFATIKNGSSNIAARLKTTNFQLLNGTGLEVAGNATITGDLTVNGTTTTIDTTNTVVSDSLIELANGTSGSPANDGGLVIERGSSDNAFIGWDESEDKFIVGTGSFTGASTGNLTVSTGTLVANIEGNVNGNVTGNVSGSSGSTTGNAATATALATGRTIGMTGDVVWTSASFDGSGNVTGTATIQSAAVESGMLNANVITGQGAYSGSVDSANDFLLIYDGSTSALKKVNVSSVLSSGGTGTMDDWTVAADTGTSQAISNAETVTFAGGAGIDSSISSNTVTMALNTEAVQDIVGAMFTSNTETDISATYQDADGTIDLVVSGGGTVSEAFKTISVSGQSDVVADGATDTLTFVAGSNITLTTDASGDSITIASADTNTQLTQEQVEDFAANVVVAGANITKTYDDAAGTLTLAATGGAANAFSTIAVSGQSNVVADAATDTLTLAAGTGMTLTTSAGSDTITFASSGGGGGTMPFTEFDGSTDNIVLSSAATGGALPVTLAGGSSDPINMTGTTQTLTSYADDDGDTKVEVERTTDNDTVHIKAGGTDVITATAAGVTITNLTVSGTTTQANELKITDTLFELNADGGSLTTDAGMIVERGSTGDNAAFIWDESTDSWVAGTTATDGSASSNLTVTEGDLKAKTQNQSDNSTKVATTSYVDTALGSLSSNSITDADSDTKIQVEESSDEDIIRADTAGQERVTIDNNVSMSARGGFFTHNATMHASETFTIASTEGTVAAGPLDVQGTVDVQGTLVVV